jgi:hypothetical protein
VRPVMSRATRTPGRASSSTAASSSSPGYHSGNLDGLDDSASLDLMDDIPIESLGRPPSTAAAAHGGARIIDAHEMLSRLERKYNLPSAGVQSGGAAERRGAGRQEELHHYQQQSSERSGRRIMSTPRRPHASSSTVVAADANAHHDHNHRCSSTTPPAAHTGHTADMVEGYRGGGEREVGPSSGTGSSAGELNAGLAGESASGSGEAGASTNAAQSADAYRFLLNHIDAEIAALQRRHSAVTTQRQHVQTRQTQRIKELFELMEAPWTLLPTEMQPALPATGVDVYIKEQQLARQQRLGSSSNGSSPAAHDGQDKMYVLALHKNFKSMPAGRKRFYEEAANYNAAVREEMKYQLSRGCARFEAFLDRVQECTMEMAREGQVPELPSGHAHQHRFHGQRGGPSSYRHYGTSHRGATAEEPSRSPKHRPQSGHETEGTKATEGEEDAAEDATHAPSDGTASSKDSKRKGGKGASRRIKEAAKASAKDNTKSSADTSADVAETETDGGTAAADGKSSRKHKGGNGDKASAHAKNSRTAKAGHSKKKATKTVKRAKAPVTAAGGGGGGGKGGHSTKSAAGTSAASSSGSGVSRSIPLPNLTHLSRKKAKHSGAPAGKLKKAAAPKPVKAKVVGGGKKQKK